MNLINLEQGSAPWREWRRQGIGGSDLPAILGISPYEDATRLQVIESKVFGREGPSSFQMRRGNYLEPIARQHLNRQLIAGEFAVVCMERPDEPWQRASLDGWLEGVAIAEIKAPAWEVHDAVLCGLVPDYFETQCQWNMHVSGLELCHFVSVTDNKKFLTDEQKFSFAEVMIAANADRQAELVKVARECWTEVLDLMSFIASGKREVTTVAEARALNTIDQRELRRQLQQMGAL